MCIYLNSRIKTCCTCAMSTCDCFLYFLLRLLRTLEYWFLWCRQIKWLFILLWIPVPGQPCVVITSTTILPVVWTSYLMARYLGVFLYINVALLMVYVDLVSFIVLKVPCLICRHTKSRSLFCTPTTLVMLISTHTSSAIL